jgi:hypothetical protein
MGHFEGQKDLCPLEKSQEIHHYMFCPRQKNNPLHFQKQGYLNVPEREKEQEREKKRKSKRKCRQLYF